MKYLILCLFLLCGELLVCAQHMLSRQFPFFYQLSSNEIFDIYQDRTGYLWIGTTNGLARYDGYGLQTFRSDYKNLNLLSDNSIVCITDNDMYGLRREKVLTSIINRLARSYHSLMKDSGIG